MNLVYIKKKILKNSERLRAIMIFYLMIIYYIEPTILEIEVQVIYLDIKIFFLKKVCIIIMK